MTDLATLGLAYSERGLPCDLTLRQIAMLGLLCDEPGPHHTGVLAQRLKVAKPIISRATYKLTMKGLVTYHRPEGDLRLRVIEPTESGRAFRASLCEIGD